MANIERIVNATILLRTAPVAEKSFSDMIILGDHNFSARRVTSVASPAELTDKGVSPDDKLYKAVSAAFAQEPGVSVVYIARRVPSAATLKVAVPQLEAGEVFSVSTEFLDASGSLQTPTFTYTAVGDTTDDTAAKVATLLAAIITADTTLTASATLDTITLTLTGGVPAVTAVSANITSQFGASTESVVNAMNAARRENDIFYGVTATTRVLSEQLALADWIESNEKLGGFATGAADAFNGSSTTDLIARIRNKNLFRSYASYGGQATDAGGEYPEVAWMSRKFREQPGSETWANATLSLVTADNLDEASYKAITAKNGNSYEPFRTLALTQNGKVGGGEWIDVIRFRDWLLEKIRVDQLSLFVNNRIGFTDEGIAGIRNKLLGSLNKGRDVGGIAPEELDPITDRIIPSYTTVIPSASSFSANEKAQRKLTGVKFTARLTGAIHAVEINGTLAYEL